MPTMRRVTSATGCRARIQNLNYHLRTPMPSVSNVRNALDTSQCLQLHKLKIDEGSKSSLLHPLLTPKSLPSLSKSTTLPPSQLMAPLSTLFLIFQVTPHCVALPVCFLFTTLQIVLILALFSLHRFSPPYTCSPIQPCYSLSIANLIFLQSSVLAPLLHYEYVPPYIQIVTTKGRYICTCNHFIPCLSNTDALGRLGLYCLQPSSYGWGRGGEAADIRLSLSAQVVRYCCPKYNTQCHSPFGYTRTCCIALRTMSCKVRGGSTLHAMCSPSVALCCAQSGALFVVSCAAFCAQRHTWTQHLSTIRDPD